MDSNKIAQTIIGIMYEKGIIERTIQVDVHEALKGHGAIDSMSFIELIVALEEQYEFEFDDTELDFKNFENVNTIVSTVMTHLNGESA